MNVFSAMLCFAYDPVKYAQVQMQCACHSYFVALHLLHSDRNNDTIKQPSMSKLYLLLLLIYNSLVISIIQWCLLDNISPGRHPSDSRDN